MAYDHRTPDERTRDERSANVVHNWTMFAFCSGSSAGISALMWLILANDSTPDPDEQAWLPLLQFVTVVGAIVVVAYALWCFSLEAHARGRG
ncbi:UNVERIFIED_ORG: hypothetical protein J2X79_003709 [Arthrobacter globiformis]|uniref:hypothetical protein n=1 Tax=Arthrobacter sp. UNC362MFTsu5.1 TaxID=1449044 RepID=UPI0004864A4C|nr:hypothetical protein [Arthrobacter sp. UNC362MFTsu5.1]MDP9696130.1 hypothetical protein [Arthrobacter globiformis]